MSTTGIRSFDQSLSTTLEWLKDVQSEMGFGDIEDAYAATRAVLIALRDRLTVQEAADFAAQLPMLLQGVYYHGYKPGGKPIKMKTSDEFVDYVAKNLVRQIDPVHIVHAVFAVFKRRVTEGEITDVMNILPQEIAALWP